MKLSSFLFVLIFVSGTVLMVSCPGQGKDNHCRRIYDFEEEKDLDGLRWKCHTWYQRSLRHATHGRFSLEVQMYPPETYPGFGLADLKGAWKGIKTVRLDIFNPAPKPVQVTFRIDDRSDPPYEDRLNKRIWLQQGLNNVVLDLAVLTTSGTGRHLNTADICAFMFFTVSPNRPVTIFIDNIRLCK